MGVSIAEMVRPLRPSGNRLTTSAGTISAGLILFVALLVPVVSTAGNIPDNPRYLFEPIGDDMGLATRGATTMHQDQVGFIWIGTQDGLFRYDGAQVKRFSAADGAPWAEVDQIIGSPDGDVWVAAEGDIARFDGLGFESLNIASNKKNTGGITLDISQPMAFDRHGQIYLATNNGLALLDPLAGKVKKNWAVAEGFPSPVIHAVHVAPDGLVWFAAGGQVGRLRPESGKVELFDLFEGVPNEDIVAILVNEAGTVWVRTRNSLLRMNNGESVFTTACEEIAESASDGMPSLDHAGNILVPTRIGLLLQQGDEWEQLSEKNGLRVNAVWSVLEDREGSLWIGLGGAGVSWSPGRGNWSAWTSREGLPDDGIWGIIRDPMDRLWVGTNQGVGIWLPDEARWDVLTKEDGILGDSVWKLVLGNHGEMWSLSRRLGITRIDLETLTPEIVTLPERFLSGPTDMVMGPEGDIWVGGNQYLLRIHVGEEELTFEDIPYPDEIIGCTEVVSVSDDGVVWTGGQNGLGRFDGEKWGHFTKKDGLLVDRLEYLSAESGATVWIDYRASVGITRFELTAFGPAVRRYGSEDGLTGDTVFLLKHDAVGRVWVGTADGLSVISRDGTVTSFDTGDGLIWNDISQGGLWSEPDGAVFIGTGRGLAYYRPSDKTVQSLPPDVVITSATLGGSERILSDNPIVPYASNTFVARYSGLVFRDSARTIFRYRLEGLEQEYVETNQREVRYPALPMGSYKFEVMCANADGVWSEESAVFSFVVESPWWEDWWARFGGGAVLVLIVFLILEIRTRKLARDRRRLEAAVTERSAQLAEANRELREMSFTDALTMVRNRRFFSSVIDSNVSDVLRKNDPRNEDASDRTRDLIFYMVDIDFFKKVNDVLGHMTGDKVLVETASRLGMSIRQSDLLVRWGGEEFLIVCRNTVREEGHMVTQRILDLIGATPFETEKGQKFRRTCSVGWAVLPSYREHPMVLPHEAVIELADKALYLAKESGRNCGVGVEVIPEAYDQDNPAGWLNEPLSKLDGKYIKLTRVDGPAPTPDPNPLQETTDEDGK